MKITVVVTSLVAAIKSVWFYGSPFAAFTALWPVNEEGKYVIEAEGIRLAFTNHAGALTNLWINDTKGREIDIVLGLDKAEDYLKQSGNPFLGGAIGMYSEFMILVCLTDPGSQVATQA
jgi:aldose 1-epimerase